MPLRFHFISLALLLVPTVHAGGAKSPVPPALGWQWKFSGGPTWQQIGELSFKGGTRSQSLTLPSFVGFDSLTIPPVGDDSAYADREYNDGFVRQDGSTGFDGLTAYWGYDNASQSQGGNLIYQATGWQSIRTDIPVTTRGRRAEEDLQSAGIEIRADVLSPWTLGPFRVGGTVSLGFASDRQSIGFSNHNTTQIRDDYRLDYQDSYDLDGVIPPGPGYEGPSNGPGPLIPNIPTIRAVTPELIATDTANFNNLVNASFRDDVLGLAAGPSLVYQDGPLDFVLSAGVIFELHHYKTSQVETLTVTHDGGSSTFEQWSDSESGTKLRPGVFIQAGLGYRIDNDWQLSGFIRGETATDFSARAGRSSFEFDTAGYTIGLQLGIPF